ncbi:glutamate racemase [Cellvibrio sp. OA-2007]|uniref:glutamate racemase n=1 Tax=Cellvibrio sp. OA-2007 TaxID=529823 RepID=UPI0007854707|nr:glutamate racemase [Cellvibrio sp. OA-2007]
MTDTTQTFQAPRVLVFDSGVGGLSVAQEIQQRLPQVSLVYASDNAFFPYGTKGEAELIARVDQVITALLARYPADILVIACNTASTLTLPHLRSKLNLPIVGVVPAIKPAALMSKSGVIGLLATPATVARPYTHELIREYATNCQVISLGSSALVHIAEQKLRGEAIDSAAIEAITQELMNTKNAEKMDVLVLACTHFPLLKEELAQQLPARINLIDSGAAIARRVEFLLADSEDAPAGYISEHIAVFTKETAEATQLAPALARFNIDQQTYLNI